MTEEKTEEEKTKPGWVKIKPAEVEKIVIDLYSKGNSMAKIGLILRDEHGVPKAKVLGKRIGEILKNAKVKLNSSKEKIQTEIDTLNRHLEKNKHDQPARKRLIKQLWAIKRAKEAI